MIRKNKYKWLGRKILPMILIVSILSGSILITSMAQNNEDYKISESNMMTSVDESDSNTEKSSGENENTEAEPENIENDLEDAKTGEEAESGNNGEPDSDLEETETGEDSEPDSDLEEIASEKDAEAEIDNDLELEEMIDNEEELTDEVTEENFEARIYELLQGVDVRSLADVQAAAENIDLLAAEYDVLSEEDRELLSSECKDLLSAFINALTHIREIGSYDCMDESCILHYPSGWNVDSEDDVMPLTLADFGINTADGARMWGMPASLPTSKTYVITDDNENNTHTGIPDKDIDTYMSNSDANYPIEVCIDVSDLPVQSLYMAIKAYDVDEEYGEIDKVFINDKEVGCLSGNDSTWNTTLLKLPIGCLKKGKNYVSITVSDGWVVAVDWFQLLVDGGSHDTNLQNYSLTILDSQQSKYNIIFSTQAIVTQSGSTEYFTEYMLLDNDGNNLDSKFGTITSKELLDLSMPQNSKNGTYTILGILKDGDDLIKAQDSINFEYRDGVAYFDTKVTHHLNPNVLTNTDVAVSLDVESTVPGKAKDITVWYGGEDITDSYYEVAQNGSYRFNIQYAVGNETSVVPYVVTVDNIDKTPPSIQCDDVAVEEDTILLQIEAALKNKIEISDNVSITEDGYVLDVTAVNPNIPGTYQAVITATDTVGNKATKNVSVTVNAKPARLVQAGPVRSGNSFDLSASLVNTGSREITESGFVWSISQYPTMEMNHGSSISVPAVTQKGGQIVANTGTIVPGLNYYSRAYVKDSKGTVHYSNQETFSIDGKTHGIFSLQYSGNDKFVIARNDGSDDKQTVYYRTHNGSAVAGTHYTKTEGAVTFEQGEVRKEVTVPLLGTASTWQNADRNFYLDIYRVEGGGTLNSSMRMAEGTVNKTISKEVPTEVYEYRVLYQDSGEHTAKNNSVYKVSFNESIIDNQNKDYLFADGNHMGIKYKFDGYEQRECYQYATLKSNAGDVIGKGRLQLGGTTVNASREWFNNLGFPDVSGIAKKHGPTILSGTVTDNNASFHAGHHTSFQMEYDVSGDLQNEWWVRNQLVQGKLVDTTGPYTKQALFNDGYTYTSGDMLYVSLKLNEVVQVLNSTPTLRVQFNTGSTLGSTLDLEYKSGDLTDTLCFGAVVPSEVVATSVSIVLLENSDNIVDFSNNSFGAVGNGSGNMEFQSISSTITPATSGTLPRHLATVGANMSSGIVLKSLQYAWTNSAAMPLSGWSNASNGQKLTTSMGTGTYYLHLLATAESGISSYTKKSFQFQQMEMQVTGPDNPNVWKSSKALNLELTAVGSTGATVVMTRPDGTIQNYTSNQSIVVTEEGAYQFAATDHYGSSLTQTIQVNKIDSISPIITIAEDDKDKKYTGLTLGVQASDTGGSELETLEYAWSDNVAVPVSGWNSVPVSGVIPEKTDSGSWYLHIRAIDGAGNTAAGVSGAYQVVGIQMPDDAPKITASYTGHTEWKKDPVNLTYTITKGTSDLDQIGIPGGQLTNASSPSEINGSLLVEKNGLYTFVAIDLNGNFVNETVLIDYIDNQPPRVTYQYKIDKGTFINMQATDLITPRYDSNGQNIGYEGSGVASLQWKYEAEGEYADFISGENIPAPKNGDYHIKATDKAGNVSEFKISVNKLSSNLAITCADVEYGDSLSPTVTNESNATATVEYKKKDALDDTYTTTIPSALGEYTVRATVDATKQYHAAMETDDFSIKRKNINANMVELIADKIYTGNAHIPEITVKVNNIKLLKDTDYTVLYEKNKHAGQAEVTITGQGNYTGSPKVYFKIQPKEITFAVDAVDRVTYTGEEHTPAVTVKDGMTEELTLGSDYTVSYANNNAAGQAEITITGKGNYEGSSGSVNFEIDKAVLTPSIDFAEANNKTYDGKTEISGTPVIILSGAVFDELPAATAVIAFVDANVDDKKSVNADNISLSGDWGNNYKLSVNALNHVDSPLNITKKDIGINHVDVLNKPYDGTKSAEAGAVTFTGLVEPETLTAGTDFSAAAIFTDSANAANGTKSYTYTVTMLNTVTANNYYLVDVDKSGKDGTISKIDYNGTKIAVAKVIANQITTDAQLNLPNLPDGGVYQAVGTIDGAEGFIASNNINKQTLTYSTTGQELDTQATITIPVTGAINYNDYDVTVTIITRDATNAEKADYDLDALTFDDIKNGNTDEQYITSDLTLVNIGSIYGSVITWSSSDASIIDTDGTVTRPASGSGDETVVLTAVITNGSINREKEFTLIVKPIPSRIGNVSGVVTDSSGIPVRDAVIKVQLDDVIVDSVETDDNGFYSFSNLPYGIYSLVVARKGSVITKIITVKSPAAEFDIIVPLGNTNTYVEIKNKETPIIAVDNLNAMFEPDDIAAAQIGTVTVKLVVEKIKNPVEEDLILQNLGNYKIGMYLDIKLVKTIAGTANDCTDRLIQPPNGEKVKIVVELPQSLRGLSDYKVIRVHEGNIAILPIGYDSTLGTLTFEADLFSTYAIVYEPYRDGSETDATSGGRDDKSDTDAASGGGNGKSDTASTYWIEVPEARTMAKDALDKRLDYAHSSRATITGIRKDSLHLLAESSLHYYHDVVHHDVLIDNAVQIKVYIADPAKATKDILVSGHVSGNAVTILTEQLQKQFPNKIAVICMDQQGDFGMNLRITAKVDVSGMDTDRLSFYSYDRLLGKYTRIPTEYELDKYGFIHFDTTLAGDIIITTAPLDSGQTDNKEDASSQKVPTFETEEMPKQVKMETDDSVDETDDVNQSDSSNQPADTGFLSIGNIIVILLLIALAVLVIISYKKRVK